jgi:hypothetical protein
VRKVKILSILFSLFLMGCAVPIRSSKPHPEQTGFRGIKWGTEISALTGMEKVEEEKSPSSDLVWYAKRGDTLAIGKAKLRNIFYAFWLGNFESVWIDFEGDDNFETLKRELFQQYGKVLESAEIMENMKKKTRTEPLRIEQRGEFYAWEGKETEMSLSYSKDRHVGTLSMNSRKISEERRGYEKQKEKEERLKGKGS